MSSVYLDVGEEWWDLRQVFAVHVLRWKSLRLEGKVF